MVKYTLKRLLMAVVTLWVIITMTFVLMHAIPGNPFADEKAYPAGDHGQSERQIRPRQTSY